MKAIQIVVDERLLARLDRDDEVKRLGRSAVFRQAIEAYLRQRRKRDLREAYQRAYSGRRARVTELNGWVEEGAWPEP